MATLITKKMQPNIAKNLIQRGLFQQPRRNLGIKVGKNEINEEIQEIKKFNLQPQTKVNQYLENARKEQREYIKKIKDEKKNYPLVITDFKVNDLTTLAKYYFMPNNVDKAFLEYTAEKILKDKQPNEKGENVKQNKEDFNILTKNINNKILIANILLILSIGTLIYLDINNNDIQPYDDFNPFKLPIKKEETEEIIIEEKNLINRLIDTFYAIINKIRNIKTGLYNSLKTNFNILLSLPNISYNYILIIFESINKIRDINLYYKTLNNFNILCKNIIIGTSEETKKLIGSFKTIIGNYVRLSSNKLGNIAINNFNIFMRLLNLPNVNKEELIGLFNNYINSLRPELIIINLKELAKLIKENHFENVRRLQQRENPNLVLINMDQIAEFQKDSMEYAMQNKNSENITIATNNKLLEKEKVAKEGIYDYINSYFSKNKIVNEKETKKSTFEYLQELLKQEEFNKEELIYDQIKKAEKLITNPKLKNLINDSQKLRIAKYEKEVPNDKELPDILRNENKKLFENKQIFDDLNFFVNQL
jgi:hypothetical protein